MLQKYQYELDQHLGSIPMNEFMWDHMHDNYNYQIQLLDDHLIHSCMFAAERTVPFTKPKNKHHRLGGMNTSEKWLIMHYIGIDYIFNMADRSLVISLKWGNWLGLFIIGKWKKLTWIINE